MRSAVEHDIRPLSEREAEVYVASTCFKTGPPGSLGIEIERLVYDEADPHQQVPASRVREALSPVGRELPGGGVISLEPGGQVELSSSRAPDLAHLIAATRADLAAIDECLAAAGLRPGSDALDAIRPSVRSLEHPRYAAMQHYFDEQGTAGRTMMCSTAAIQVCIDAGLDGRGSGSALARWTRLHLLAPVLVAMFANSPFRHGAPNGWRCNRQAVWLALDPQRTRAPAPLMDPCGAWTRYALDAAVLCIVSASGPWTAPHDLTMRDWLRGDGPRPATQQDVDYHLSTLFPPVRPRGFLELRVIDAQAGTDWEVAAAVVAALTEDDRASDLASEACAALEELSDPMVVAARDALGDARLAAAAHVCAKAAQDALPALGADAGTQARVARFVDRFTAEGRCPADDRLDRFTRTGELTPYDDEGTT